MNATDEATAKGAVEAAAGATVGAVGATVREAAMLIAYVPAMDSPEGWCAGCRVCELVCSLRHGSTCNPRLARIRVASWDPAVDVPVVCRQCERPLCAEVCPTEAFQPTGIPGVLRIDAEQCIGCGECVRACPFGAISVHPDTGQALKCTVCEGDPQCVKYCPAGVLKLVTRDALATEFRYRAARATHQHAQRAAELLAKAQLPNSEALPGRAAGEETP